MLSERSPISYHPEFSFSESNFRNSIANEKQAFEKVVKEAQEVFSPIGIEVTSPETSEAFWAQPAENRHRCITNLHESSKQYSSLIRKNVDFSNDKGLLDEIKKQYNLDFDHNFMRTFQNGDAIEIIDLNGMQVYRNFTLLNLTDYNLVDLCGWEWTDLFERDSSITRTLLGFCQEHFTGERSFIADYVPEHLMIEKRSRRRIQFIQKFRCTGVVKGADGQTVGLISAIRADMSGEAKTTKVQFMNRLA